MTCTIWSCTTKINFCSQ